MNIRLRRNWFSPYLSLCVALSLALAALAGCASTEEQAEDGEGERAQSERSASSGSEFSMQASLAPDAEGVHTIQVYGGGNQRELPVARLYGDDQLTLEFDLLGRNGRTLSVYFYHADRSWERDLAPVEYMESYRNDELLSYEASRSTQQPYIHYEYAFPNEDIQFLVSGNYIVRVTEQGDEDEVLFERAFFISEQSASAEFRLRRQRLASGALPSFQPILNFEPPRDLANGSIFDYNTCFVPNGRFSETRCTSRPQSLQQDALRFDLDPRQAFQVEGSSYGLDLRDISAGGSVLEVDRGATPPRVWLVEDDARFPGASEVVALTGQTVIGSQGGGDEDLLGEYVRANFSFVPPAQRALSRDVYVASSFNGWRPTEKHRLRWRQSERRYEGEILLKQGQYAYRYVSQDPTLRRVLRETVPQTRNRFTAFVYYRDVSQRTDRLVSISQTIAQ